MNASVLRRCQIGLLSVGGLITVMMGVMVGGCYLNDMRIDAHRGTAVADVVNAGRFSTAVSFVGVDGQVHNPRLGVLYPTDLTTGQRISVDYDTSSPDLVRVAGRRADLAWLPALTITGWSWAGVIAAMIVMAEYARRRAARNVLTA